MPEGTESPTGTSTTSSTGPTLEQFAGSLDGPGFLSGFTTERDAPSPAEPAASSPADAAPAPEPALGSEGPADETRPAEPAVASAEAPPDATTPDDAWRKDATPLTYQVNGQARPIEGIHVLGDKGAIVDATVLPQIAKAFSDRDHLLAQDRVKYQRIQELERLTEWRTKDANGQDQTLSGLKGVEAQRVQLGRSMAALNTISQAFKGSPLQLLAQDAEGNIMWDQSAIRHLITESELAEIRAEQAVRTHLSSLTETLQSSARQQTEDAETPTRLWSAVESSWLSQHPALTPQDKQFLQAQLPRYIRAAKPEEVQTLGRTVVDGSFLDVIKDRAELRSSAATQLKTVATSTAQASRENAAKLAAAATGKRPAAAAPVVAPKPITHEQQREKDQDDAWDRAHSAASRMVRQHATSPQ